jgi:hypothetical protein
MIRPATYRSSRMQCTRALSDAWREFIKVSGVSALFLEFLEGPVLHTSDGGLFLIAMKADYSSWIRWGCRC